MRIIREVQNAVDGKYHIIENDKDEKRSEAGSGFREGDSRVVRKLLDLGLAIPQNEESKRKKREG